MAKQHRMVVCRMTMETRKKKRVKAEPKIRWWKLRKEGTAVSNSERKLNRH